MITLTDPAKNQIKKLFSQRNKGVGIRVGVRTSGCSGMAYVLEYLDEFKYEEGIVDFTYEGIIVRVSQKHLPYVDGMQIDFVKKGLNEGFEFTNPNEKDRCGCGESFRI